MSKEEKKSFKKVWIGAGLLMVVLFISTFMLSGLVSEEIGDDNSSSVNFFGTDIQETSLFVAAFAIGLLDGFNPCAMWVLIYLITLVSQLQDRKKMWVIVGTFLGASGIIYFLILTLWLNGWSYLNYIIGAAWIIKFAAVFALGTGAYFIYDYIKSKGKVECKVGDFKSRKKTMDKIKDIVHSPFTIPTFFGLVLLAFAINLSEFVCSIGLPALFTQILSVADVTLVMKYFYIFVYVLAFMADDLLIFSLALLALDSDVMNKYAGHTKLIGGILMIILGIILLFFPNLLL